MILMRLECTPIKQVLPKSTCLLLWAGFDRLSSPLTSTKKRIMSIRFKGYIHRVRVVEVLKGPKNLMIQFLYGTTN